MRQDRDEFVEKTKKVLQQRVGNRCSNPECRCLTSGPNVDPQKATSIGVAAHITAAAPNGPRYDPELMPEERKSILNGIWLCQNCAKLIDSDPSIYSVNLVQRWKAHSEELSRLELEGKELRQGPHYEGYCCPFCDTFSKKGVSVCIGCHAEIYEGSTPTEWRQDVQIGLMATVVIMMIIFSLLPSSLAENLKNASHNFGAQGVLFTIVLAGLSSISFSIWFAKKHDSSRRKRPPTFVRFRVQ